MQTDEHASWREDFTDTQQHFESWRAGRRRGERIPQALWTEAVSLAERHGVAKTATTLKLDYYAVRRRLASDLDPGTAKAPTDHDGARPRFVEVSLESTTSSITCSLEIEGPGNRGSKLRLELQGIVLADLDALLRSVWSASA